MLIANAAIRIGTRIGCVPGKYSSAGKTVWLMMKISRNPHRGGASTRPPQAKADGVALRS